MFPPKKLNMLEIDFANEAQVEVTELSRENLKMNAVGKAKLLKMIAAAEGQEKKEILKKFERILYGHMEDEQKEAAKNELRHKVLENEIPNLKRIEKNFNEKQERKKAAREVQIEKLQSNMANLG